MAEETKIKTNWLVNLLAEVESFDPEMFAPDTEVSKGEVVVGVVPESMRKLYSLGRYYDREVKQGKLELEFNPAAEHAPYLAKVDQARDKHSLLLAAFWACGQELYGLWGVDKGFGIRKGWKFVTTEKKVGPLEKLLRQIGEEE